LLGKLNTAAKVANLPALFSGYGCASLASLATEDSPRIPWTHAGTIGSVIASLLANLSYTVMDPTDAASWGLFDVAKGEFRLDIAEAAGITIPPEGFPSKIVPSGIPLGEITALSDRNLQLPALAALVEHASSVAERIIVHSSVGDHQAAVAGALFSIQKSTASTHGFTLVLSMGTSIQATAVPHDDDACQAVFRATYDALPPGCEVRPSLDGNHFFTAASMNGGNVLSWVAAKAQAWLAERAHTAGGDRSVSKEEAYEWLEKSAMEILAVHPIVMDDKHRASVNGLCLAPTLFPERVPVYTTAPEGAGEERRGEETPDFPPESFGTTYAVLAAGVLCNVCSMLPAQCWARVTGVVVAGGGFQKSQIINTSLKHVLSHFGVDIPITALPEEQLGNAGNIGIAWNALRHRGEFTRKDV
jgi:sugar (pentulose or hexulose) kinase